LLGCQVVILLAAVLAVPTVAIVIGVRVRVIVSMAILHVPIDEVLARTATIPHCQQGQSPEL